MSTNKRETPLIDGMSDTLKIPAEALLKRCRIEIGELKAYISELEDTRLRYRKKVLECYEYINQLKRQTPIAEEDAKEILREIKREEFSQAYSKERQMLTKKIHELKKENESFLERIIRYEQLLINNNIDPNTK